MGEVKDRTANSGHSAVGASSEAPTAPLPCPWCGHIGVTYFEPSTYRWGAAMCGACGVVGPEIRKTHTETVADWSPRALEEWNNRAPAEMQRPVEASTESADKCPESCLPAPVSAGGAT